MTTVVNKRSCDISYREDADNCVYIGRPTKWGNPFLVHVYGRVYAIQKFREYGEKNGLREAAKKELKGKTLVCWCKPLACHGDVLKEWADE